MAESVYKIIELVGTSTESWEAAARSAVERASSTLRDLRIAEVEKLDMTVDNNKVVLYRAKIKLSFKYEEGSVSAGDGWTSPNNLNRRAPNALG